MLLLLLLLLVVLVLVVLVVLVLMLVLLVLLPKYGQCCTLALKVARGRRGQGSRRRGLGWLQWGRPGHAQEGLGLLDTARGGQTGQERSIGNAKSTSVAAHSNICVVAAL